MSECFGPFVPSASVDETNVKSPLVGENCMIDSDQSSDFNQNHTHHRRSDTFTPLPRLTIPTDLFSDRTAGSKQSWRRKQEVQKKQTTRQILERRERGRHALHPAPETGIDNTARRLLAGLSLPTLSFFFIFSFTKYNCHHAYWIVNMNIIVYYSGQTYRTRQYCRVIV